MAHWEHEARRLYEENERLKRDQASLIEERGAIARAADKAERDLADAQATIETKTAYVDRLLAKLADARREVERLREEARSSLRYFAADCPTHQMSGFDPACDACQAKNDGAPFAKFLRLLAPSFKGTAIGVCSCHEPNTTQGTFCMNCKRPIDDAGKAGAIKVRTPKPNLGHAPNPNREEDWE